MVRALRLGDMSAFLSEAYPAATDDNQEKRGAEGRDRHVGQQVSNRPPHLRFLLFVVLDLPLWILESQSSTSQKSTPTRPVMYPTNPIQKIATDTLVNNSIIIRFISFPPLGGLSIFFP